MYAAGEARRGVLLVLAEWHDFGTLLLVKPRGAALSDQAKPAALAHAMARRCAHLAVESADSWEVAFARVQRLLPTLQAEAKGPLLAFAQSCQPVHELQGWLPALRQMPTVPVPHNATDDVFEQALQLGGAWQAAALDRALTRAQELSPWWEQRPAHGDLERERVHRDEVGRRRLLEQVDERLLDAAVPLVRVKVRVRFGVRVRVRVSVRVGGRVGVSVRVRVTLGASSARPRPAVRSGTPSAARRESEPSSAMANCTSVPTSGATPRATKSSLARGITSSECTLRSGASTESKPARSAVGAPRRPIVLSSTACSCAAAPSFPHVAAYARPLSGLMARADTTPADGPSARSARWGARLMLAVVREHAAAPPTRSSSAPEQMQPPCSHEPSTLTRASRPGEPPYEPRSSSRSEMAARARPTCPPGSGSSRISSSC